MRLVTNGVSWDPSRDDASDGSATYRAVCAVHTLKAMSVDIVATVKDSPLLTTLRESATNAADATIKVASRGSWGGAVVVRGFITPRMRITQDCEMTTDFLDARALRQNNTDVVAIAKSFPVNKE